MLRRKRRYLTQGVMSKMVLFRSLTILFICMTISVSAKAQDDFEALQRRLAEIEAAQAKAQATIEALSSEIEAMRGESKNDPLQEPKEAQKVEADLPPDAGTREKRPATSESSSRLLFVQLTQEARFGLQSKDGAFTLDLDGIIAMRYEINRRSDDGSGSSDTDSGFENTATRINFRGKIFGDYGYWVRLQADEFGEDPRIDVATGLWFINEDTILAAGQFPSVWTRSQGLPLDRLQTAESSPTNFTFDPFAYKGVILGYHTPRFVIRGLIHDGYRSVNNSAFDEPSAKWGLGGQVLGLAVGVEEDWKRFDNFTSRPGGDFVWLLNGSFLVQEGDSHGKNDASSDLFLGIVESSMEGDGWNLYGAGYYRYTDQSGDGIKADDFGFVLQGGTWVAKHVEVYSRFDMTIPDNDRPTENENFKTLTTGASFYPIPRTDNIKLSTEFLYMFDSEADSIVESNTFSSVRESPDGDQWVIRVQTTIRW